MTVWITRRPDDEVATELKASRGPLAGANTSAAAEFRIGRRAGGQGLEADLAIGTDTGRGRSGRSPPVLQGIVGIKPTVGVISTDGVVPASESYDCVTISLLYSNPRTAPWQ